MTDQQGGTGPRLPDFSAGPAGGAGSGGPSLPDFSRGAGGTGQGGGPHTPWGGESGGAAGSGRPNGGPPGRGPRLALLLGGVGCLVVALVVVALVLSQTVFRGADEEETASPSAGPTPIEAPSTRPPEVTDPPTPTDQDPATPAEEPTVACTVHDNETVTAQEDGVVRGGGLEFPVQEGWEVGSNWGSQGSYMTDQHFADQPVEGGWYTVAGVGAVEFAEDEGGYPGAEEAARAIFQCSLTREQGEEIYGSPAQLRNLRDEATTIDGHDAWIVSADVEISDLAILHSTDAWRLVVIVVDTPSGPAAFDGGAALGHSQQVTDLEAMIDGLRVL